MNVQCQECKAKCCKVLLFYLPPDRRTQEFYRRRDCFHDGPYLIVKSRCPALGDDDRCIGYENRPLACKEFNVNGPICKICKKLEI